MTTRVLYLRVDVETHKRLRQLADERGLPMNTVADMVLAEGLGIPDQRRRRLRELLERIT